MFQCLLLLSSTLAFPAIATTLSSTPTFAASFPHHGSHAKAPLTTPPPTRLSWSDLRRRQNDDSNVCGYSGDQYWTCNVEDSQCAATILPNGKAYQYCSYSEVANQYIYTTAYGNWSANRDCPTSAVCCGGTEAGVETNYYIASGYTVTGWGCDPSPITYTWNPDRDVLWPPSFSQSLKELSKSLRSSTSSSTRTTSATGTATNTSSGSSGLSSGAKAGIGAGVGAGVGVLLIGGAVFFFYRRRQKNKERIAEIQPSRGSYHAQPPYGSQPGYGHPPPHSPNPPYTQPAVYNPQMSYNDTQFKQDAYQGQTHQSQWGGMYDQSPLAAKDAHMSASYAGQSPIGWDQPQELPSQPYSPRP